MQVMLGSQDFAGGGSGPRSEGMVVRLEVFIGVESAWRSAPTLSSLGMFQHHKLNLPTLLKTVPLPRPFFNQELR